MDIDFNKYKMSKYNRHFIKDSNLFIHNSFTGAFVKIDDHYRPVIEQALCDRPGSLSVLSELPESIQQGMIKGGYIINQDVEEFNILKSLHSLARFKGGNTLVLTLLPTLGCNFRCPYCFEKEGNYPTKKMSQNVIDAIVDYVDKNLNNDGHLSISWYGGEPLLAFDVIEKCLNQLNQLAQVKNLTIKSSMVSNGYLLDKKMSKKLLELGIDLVQVTIDGPKEIHDQTRILANGKGSFSKIIENLQQIDDSLNVSIRVNIQKSNIARFSDLLESLKQAGLNNKRNIQVYSAPVRDYSSDDAYVYSSCYSTGEYSVEELRMNEQLQEYGFKVGENISPNLSVCGAISENALVIEPDGTLQKCWNVVGEQNERVGNILYPDKEYSNNSVEMINLSKWYSWSGYENVECKSCKALPLCMGGCPYYTINQNEKFESEEYKCSSRKYNMEDVLISISNK